MRLTSKLVIIFLTCILASCTDDQGTTSLDGDEQHDGDSEHDQDQETDGDMGTVGDKEVELESEADGDETEDEDEALDGDDIEQDFEREDWPDIFPDSVTCWKNSSHAASDSTETVEAWISACENADSGHDDYRCYPVKITFWDTNSVQYAIQCEAWHVLDLDPGFSTDITRAWLGPAYGNLGNDMNLTAQRATGLAHARYYLCGPPDASFQMMPPVEAVPPWTIERIDDALAHDISDKPCESITDYRKCVRSFQPPNSHCAPVFEYPNEVMSITAACDWENDPLFYTADFVSCITVHEPRNGGP